MYNIKTLFPGSMVVFVCVCVHIACAQVLAKVSVFLRSPLSTNFVCIYTLKATHVRHTISGYFSVSL